MPNELNGRLGLTKLVVCRNTSGNHVLASKKRACDGRAGFQMLVVCQKQLRAHYMQKEMLAEACRLRARLEDVGKSRNAFVAEARPGYLNGVSLNHQLIFGNRY